MKLTGSTELLTNTNVCASHTPPQAHTALPSAVDFCKLRRSFASFISLLLLMRSSRHKCHVLACTHPPTHPPRHNIWPWPAPTQQHTLAGHLLAKNRVTGSSPVSLFQHTKLAYKNATIHAHACMAMPTACTLVCVPRSPYRVARAPCCRGPRGQARHGCLVRGRSNFKTGTYDK